MKISKFLSDNASHLVFDLDQVIPVEWARKNKPFLENLGIDYKYSEFPVGHGVNPQNFMEFKNWLAKN